jgi:hypothetical protein
MGSGVRVCVCADVGSGADTDSEVGIEGGGGRGCVVGSGLMGGAADEVGSEEEGSGASSSRWLRVRGGADIDSGAERKKGVH